MAIVNKKAVSTEPKIALCANCNRDVATLDGYCTLCRCWACNLTMGQVNNMNTDKFADVYIQNGSAMYKYICTSCFQKTYADKMCQHCKKRIANMLLCSDGVKEKKPSVCDKCLKFVETECWWCRGAVAKAHYLASFGEGTFSVVTCKTCHNTPSCHKDGCNPSRPCSSCLLIPDDEITEQVLAGNNHGQSAGIYFKQSPKFHRTKSIMERKKNRSSRMMSAEIESTGLRWVEDLKHGSTHYNQVDYKKCLCFHCKNDRLVEIKKLVLSIGGSIVPDESIGSTGFEINMPPAAGDYFVNFTQQVSDLLHESMAMVTKKAGTHLHLDASDYSWSDMRKFLILYAKTEPAFLFTQPYDRVYKSPKPHCRPCGNKYLALADKFQYKNWKPAMAEIVYDGEWPRPPRYFRGNNRAVTARYDFVNIHSWFYRGTVEVRGHSGTIDASKIINWGIIWSSFMDAASKMTEKEILSLPKNEPKQILLSIAPSHTHPYLFNRWEVFEPEYIKKGKV